MVALLWAQWKQTPRVLKADLLVVLSFLVIAPAFGFVAFVAAKEGFFAEQSRLVTTMLAVSLIAAAILSGNLLPSYGVAEEWVFSLPIRTASLVTYFWSVRSILVICMVVILVMPLTLGLAVGMSKGVEPLSVSLLLIVLLLNATIGALAQTILAGRNNEFRLLARVWLLWVSLIFLSALCSVIFVGLDCAIKGTSFDEWLNRVTRWIETPTAIVALLPVIPTYFAVKAVVLGLNMSAVLGTVLLFAIALIFLFGAKDSLAPFREFLVVQLEQTRRLSAMGIEAEEALAKEAVRSSEGFGEGETTFLWLYWLTARRSQRVWEFLITPIVLFALVPSPYLVAEGEDTSVFPISVIGVGGAFAIAVAILEVLPPEWQKSLPLSVPKVLIVSALPKVLVVVLGCLGLLLGVAVFRPEILGIAQVVSFLLVSPICGFSVAFASQALGISLREMLGRLSWTFVVFWGVVLIPVYLLLLTLTPYFLLGLLLSCVTCWLMFEWAKTNWHRVL